MAYEENETCGVGAAIEVAERLSEMEPVTLGAADLIVIPEGKKVHDLLEHEQKRLANPVRRTGRSVHTTLASFIDHVARHRDSQSAIFADEKPAAPSFLAIYDYNEATEVHDLTSEKPSARAGLPRFGVHRAFYAMPFSDEWLAWQKIAGPASPWMSQREFAEALEDRAIEVIAPSDIPTRTREQTEALGIAPASGGTLLALARGLIVTADRKVGSAQNLATGEGRIVYEETHTTSDEAGKQVAVPTGFVVAAPVFRDAAPIAMIVRLRYKLEGVHVKWKLSLHRSDVAFRDAFYEVARDVRTKTGLPLFYGAPES